MHIPISSKRFLPHPGDYLFIPAGTPPEKAEPGINFSAHRQNTKIEAAKHLLRHAQVNINDAAAKTGYRAKPFFFKRFKRFTGMTPQEYARKLGAPEE